MTPLFKGKMLARALQDPDVRTLLEEVVALEGEVAAKSEQVSAASDRFDKHCEKLEDRLDEKEAELERLRSGKFTAEEIQNFCHDLGKTVTAEEFAAGCVAEQCKWYGRAPDREESERLRVALTDARNTYHYDMRHSGSVDNCRRGQCEEMYEAIHPGPSKPQSLHQRLSAQHEAGCAFLNEGGPCGCAGPSKEQG